MGVGRGIGGWTGLLVRVTVMEKRRSRRRRNMLLSFLHDLQHNNYILSHNRFYYFLTWHAIKVQERERCWRGTCMLRPSSHHLCPVHQTLGGWWAAAPLVACPCPCLSARQVASSSHPTLQERRRACVGARTTEDEGGKKEVFTRQIFTLQRSGLKQKQTNFTELKDFRPIRVQ